MSDDSLSTPTRNFKKSYSELLRDPRWQKKRLEVMQRDGFACELCHATDKTLNVHHGYYEPGVKPWEYPIGTLSCLCEECHELSQHAMTMLHRQLGLVANPRMLDRIRGYVIGQRMAAGNIRKEPEEQTDDVLLGISDVGVVKCPV